MSAAPRIVRESDDQAPRPPLAPDDGPRILVAGVGNVFLADDAFGVEVIQRLQGRAFPPGTRVIDFGIRGYDLVYALMDEYDHVIFVDACARGGAPGSIFIIEPDLDAEPAAVASDTHTMNPLRVLQLARSQGARFRHVMLVGCEPETLGPPEGRVGLSAPVEAAVKEAATVVSLLVDLLTSRAAATPESA